MVALVQVWEALPITFFDDDIEYEEFLILYKLNMYQETYPY